jgi:hypothetical protein
MTTQAPLHLVNLVGNEQLQVIPIAPVTQLLSAIAETCTTADIARLAASVGISAGANVEISTGSISATYTAGAGVTIVNGAPGAPGTIALNQSGLPVDLYAYVPAVSGALAASQKVWEIDCIRPYTFPSNLTGSSVKADVAATASTTLTLSNGGTAVATAVFSTGGTIATLASAGFSTTTGGNLSWGGPASPDATLAGLRFAMSGTR